MSQQNIQSNVIATPLRGTIRVPGDKSISHRSVMFSALAIGTSYITGVLEGDDVLATLAVFRAMGVKVEGPNKGNLTIRGVGMQGLKKPQVDLDMGNSGTAMRLMAGILAGQSFSSTLIGDASLSKRPMLRITKPLSQMGANCQTKEGGRPPIHIQATETLKGIHYDMPIASAQVKSAVLLAGMYANGKTSVSEPAPTRNHTENMLKAYGYNCQIDGNQVSLHGGGEMVATNIDVPADISSAAFFLVAASIIPGSDLILEHVCVNPTRTGILDLLAALGANIQLLNQRKIGGEEIADLHVKYAPLKGAEINPNIVPLAIDEFPIFFIAAACAKGVTTVTGAEELRHKESDRIAAMIEGLTTLGIEIDELPDGAVIYGRGNQTEPVFTSGVVQCFHDHRIAMSFAVAGMCSQSNIIVEDSATVATSFPNFCDLGNEVGMSLQIETVLT